jgi:hypothetical protein
VLWAVTHWAVPVQLEMLEEVEMLRVEASREQHANARPHAAPAPPLPAEGARAIIDPPATLAQTLCGLRAEPLMRLLFAVAALARVVAHRADVCSRRRNCARARRRGTVAIQQKWSTVRRRSTCGMRTCAKYRFSQYGSTRTFPPVLSKLPASAGPVPSPSDAAGLSGTLIA